MDGKRLIRKIYSYYAKNLQEDWDFCGKQVGEIPPDVKKVLLCLDFDSISYKTAIDVKPDLIITHHPFIFGTQNEVFKNDPIRKKTAEDVVDVLHSCIYSFHTCFDKAEGGMNDLLSYRLELKDVYTPLDKRQMRIGYLKEEMDRDEFVNFVMERFKVPYSLGVLYGKEKIKKVALVGGGDAASYQTAIDEGADIYISGDMSHHVRREIIEREFNYLDVPHECERIFLEGMKKTLLEICPSLEITSLDHEEEPKVYTSSLQS